MCQCVRVHVGVGVRAPHAPSLWLPLSLHKYLSHFHVRACRVFAGAYKACAELEAELVDSAVVLTLQVFFFKKKLGGGREWEGSVFFASVWVYRFGAVEEEVEACGESCCAFIHPYSHTHAHAHVHPHPRAHAHMRTTKCARTHARAHTSTQARTRMHTHAHNRNLSALLLHRTRSTKDHHICLRI